MISDLIDKLTAQLRSLLRSTSEPAGQQPGSVPHLDEGLVASLGVASPELAAVIQPLMLSLQQDIDRRNERARELGDPHRCQCIVTDQDNKVVFSQHDTYLSACQGFSDDNRGVYIVQCIRQEGHA